MEGKSWPLASIWVPTIISTFWFLMLFSILIAAPLRDVESWSIRASLASGNMALSMDSIFSVPNPKGLIFEELHSGHLTLTGRLYPQRWHWYTLCPLWKVMVMSQYLQDNDFPQSIQTGKFANPLLFKKINAWFPLSRQLLIPCASSGVMILSYPLTSLYFFKSTRVILGKECLFIRVLSFNSSKRFKTTFWYDWSEGVAEPRITGQLLSFPRTMAISLALYRSPVSCL